MVEARKSPMSSVIQRPLLFASQLLSSSTYSEHKPIEQFVPSQKDADWKMKGDPATLVVLEMGDVSLDAAQWLINRISNKRENDGAELIVSLAPACVNKGPLLHISATELRLLESAEEMQLYKRDNKNIVRPFVLADILHFIIPGTPAIGSILTVSEKQRIVYHALDQLVFLKQEKIIPGIRKKLKATDKALIPKCMKLGIIKQLFPLHCEKTLRRLNKIWVISFFRFQPLREIRSYFGEEVAMYFAFISFYTSWLVIPGLLGSIVTLIDAVTGEFTMSFVLLAFCNLVWVTVFLECWKRRCSTLAYNWGTLRDAPVIEVEDIRPEFEGTERISPVTGEKELYYAKWKRDLRRFCVSLPIIFILIAFGAWVSLLVVAYQVELERKENRDLHDNFLYVLSNCVYSVFLFVYSIIYTNIAERLTNFENHKYQQKHIHSRIFKTTLLSFMVNLHSLFYYAFVLEDFEGVRSQLMTFCILLQFFEQCMEAGVPYIQHKYKEKQVVRFDPKRDEQQKVLKVARLPSSNPYVAAANHQTNLGNYPDTYTDYLAVFTQFGLVFLFSPVYPLAATISVIVNMLMIRSDAFKLVHAMKRPRGRQVRDIGIWQRTFQVVGIMAVLTNCALLAMSPVLRENYGTGRTDLGWFSIFVILEHVILVTKVIIAYLIPDMTQHVKEGLEKQRYATELALKKKTQEQQKILKQQIKSLPFRDDYVTTLCDFDVKTDVLDAQENQFLIEATEGLTYEHEEEGKRGLRQRKVEKK